MQNESESDVQPRSWLRWEQQSRQGHAGRHFSPPPPSSQNWKTSLHKSWTSGWRDRDTNRETGEYYEHHHSPGPSRKGPSRDQERAGLSRDHRMEKEPRKCWSSNPKGIRRNYEEAFPNALLNNGRKMSREEKIIQKQNRKYGEVIPKPTVQVLKKTIPKVQKPIQKTIQEVIQPIEDPVTPECVQLGDDSLPDSESENSMITSEQSELCYYHNIKNAITESVNKLPNEDRMSFLKVKLKLQNGKLSQTKGTRLPPFPEMVLLDNIRRKAELVNKTQRWKANNSKPSEFLSKWNKDVEKMFIRNHPELLEFMYDGVKNKFDTHTELCVSLAAAFATIYRVLEAPTMKLGTPNTLTYLSPVEYSTLVVNNCRSGRRKLLQPKEIEQWIQKKTRASAMKNKEDEIANLTSSLTTAMAEVARKEKELKRLRRSNASLKTANKALRKRRSSTSDSSSSKSSGSSRRSRKRKRVIKQSSESRSSSSSSGNSENNAPKEPENPSESSISPTYSPEHSVERDVLVNPISPLSSE